MEATQANLEPIFLLYEGGLAGNGPDGDGLAEGAPGGPGVPGAAIRIAGQAARTGTPVLSADTGDGIRHTLWAITDPAALAEYVTRLDAEHFQVHLHAIGDRAVRESLDAIAAAVIGGSSLMGGRGTVWGALLGALVMASLDNGMSLMNTEAFWQPIIKGSILVIAVALDMMGRKGKN